MHGDCFLEDESGLGVFLRHRWCGKILCRRMFSIGYVSGIEGVIWLLFGPIGYIVFDVIDFVLKIFVGSDILIVESRLPGKFYFVFVAIFFHHRFIRTH